MEQFPENRQTDVEANDYHITSNPHFEEHPENSNDEQTEDNEISNLRHLREDVTSRNLDIPRDCITLTRVRLGRGQFGEVQQVLVRKPDEPEILCAAKMARGMDSTNSNLLRFKPIFHFKRTIPKRIKNVFTFQNFANVDWLVLP